MAGLQPNQQKTFRYQYLLTVGIVAMEGRGFEYPIDCLPSTSDLIFVTNKSRDVGQRGVRVSILNLDSEYFGHFGLFGEEDGSLVSPSGIAENGNGHLLVLDEVLNRLTIYDQNGTYIEKWEPFNSDGHELNGPSSLAVDSNDNVFVSDTGNHRIVIFDQTGKKLFSIGSQGPNNGEFQYPWGIAIDNCDNIYVSDWGNNRIQMLSSDGLFLQSFEGSTSNNYQLNHPSSVVLDSIGNLIIADWGNESVKVVTPNDELIQELRGEATLSRWAQEFMDSNLEEYDARKTADLDNPPILDTINEEHTVSAHVEKYFWSPTSVKLDSNQRLYVTESNRHRMQIYELKED